MRHTSASIVMNEDGACPRPPASTAEKKSGCSLLTNSRVATLRLLFLASRGDAS